MGLTNLKKRNGSIVSSFRDLKQLSAGQSDTSRTIVLPSETHQTHPSFLVGL